MILRVEKISGLNSVAPLGAPTISAKPIIIISTLIAIAIAFIIKNISINKSDSAIEVINYAQILEQQEKEILSLTKEMDPETFAEMENTMNIILYESIPLSEQLPDELSDEEKMKILREYYKEKSNALKSLRLLYAQETNPID